MTKKGADLTTFGQEKKGADLTKKGADLTNSPFKVSNQIHIDFNEFLSNISTLYSKKPFPILGRIPICQTTFKLILMTSYLT